MNLQLVSSVLCLFLTFSVGAKSSYSETINYIQKKYADKFTEYPILIFDKDEVNYRYLVNDAFGEDADKEKLRVSIIKTYVEEKVGVKLTTLEATAYESYTIKERVGAYALPTMGRTYKNKTDYVMCAVFPASGNSNQQLETHRILQLDTPDTYGKMVNFEGLQEKFSYDEMKLFSLYHELGHCMDRTFMTDAYEQYEPTPHHVHLGESFAEVFGLLILELEGHKGLALKRALYRNLYSTVMGKWFADNPGYGYGSPMFAAGGSIYYLVPSILEARKRLMKYKNPLVVSNLEDIAIAAKDIVETAAYSGRSFSAIKYWYAQGEEATLETYQNYYINMPDYFDDTFSDLTDFIFQNKLLYSRLAGYEELEGSLVESAAYVPLDNTEFCQVKGSQEELLNLINQERDSLESSHESYENQLKRKNELDSIFSNLSDC